MRISIDRKTEEEKIEDEFVEEERIDEDEERVQDDILDEIMTIQNALLKDKKIQILLILSRFEEGGVTLSRISTEISADHQYTRRYLKDLKRQGLVQEYKVYPDKRLYYRLSNKGKKIAKLIHNCISNFKF